MTKAQPQSSAPPGRREATGKKDLSDRVDAAGWGLFFVWLGIAAVILGEAALRWRLGLKVGGFWVAIGAVFLLGGLWELLAVPWPLVPVLIILCGMAILWGALSGRYVMRK
ncbi:MAG: hypothetical protein JSU82_09530 [Rhodospirillales bacterium]|nr:MAG: hypothetical protein JSU82_09530 [Rhodospirillales bacterium]